MRVFDCFMFKDEIDLLEIRIRELYHHVDFFVIVESNLSHTNRPKSFFFEQHQEKFSPYLEKIRYIKHASNAHSDPWINENEQRCAINKGITDADTNDLIIVSDVDEIVRSSSINQIKKNPQDDVYGFHMPLFNFKFNYMRTYPGHHDVWAMAAKASWIWENSPQILRNLRQSGPFKHIPHGGWHFGYLGNKNWIFEKTKDTCHQEDINEEFLHQLDIEKSIQEKKCWDRRWPYEYEIVDMDQYFPEACKLFPQHCLPDSGIDILDLLSNDICQTENST